MNKINVKKLTREEQADEIVSCGKCHTYELGKDEQEGLRIDDNWWMKLCYVGNVTHSNWGKTNKKTCRMSNYHLGNVTQINLGTTH